MSMTRPRHLTTRLAAVRALTLQSVLFRGLRGAALAILSLMMLTVTPVVAHATTCTVTSLADSGAGTLRAHLEDPSCDRIDFAGLTLPATISLTSGELVVGRNVTIDGPGASLLTVMRSSAAFAFRILHISPGVSAVIDGLTISNGFTLERNFVGEYGGGGILVDGSATLALSNSTVSGNASATWNCSSPPPSAPPSTPTPCFGPGQGGGIDNRHGTLALTNSTVSGNGTCANVDFCSSANGIRSRGTLTLIGSSVSNNLPASYAGGILTEGPTTIIDSTISGNHARSGPGGIWAIGNLTISGSTISGNSATLGFGGIYFSGNYAQTSAGDNYTLTLVNSSVVGNRGGGVFNDNAIVRVTNTTFSGNSNEYDPLFTGAAIATWWETGSGPDPVATVITHSTFSGNTPHSLTFYTNPSGYPQAPELFSVRNSIFADAGSSCSDASYNVPISDGGFNLEHGSSCGFTAAGSQSNVDPLLGPLQNDGGSTWTHPLVAGSPAIDAGACTDLQGDPVTTDQRGIARPQGTRCDIGAYEVDRVFTGFFAPVANAPTVNFVKAGQAIPVKFSLGGDFGLAIVAAGSPASQQVACALSSGTATIADTVTAGSSSLTYDPATQTYTYVWKTDKSWANTCRRLKIAFSDGSVGAKTAEFSFTK